MTLPGGHAHALRTMTLAERLRLAESPTCPPELLILLADDPVSDVQTRALQNRALSTVTVERFTISGRSEAGLPLYDPALQLPTSQPNPAMSVEMLVRVAAAAFTSEDRLILRGVLVNPLCPRAILDRGLEVGSSTALIGLAGNPALPEDLAIRLLLSDDEDVRGAVAENAGVPVHLLGVLSEERDVGVLHSLMWRLCGEAKGYHVRRLLAGLVMLEAGFEMDPSEARILGASFVEDPATVSALCSDDDELVREAVADNPAATDADLVMVALQPPPPPEPPSTMPPPLGTRGPGVRGRNGHA